MGDKYKWTNTFNNTFQEFINDLINTFPDDKSFKLCKQSFTFMKNIDDTKPIEMFRVYALKYREQIISRDEGFFLNHDFKDEITADNVNLSVEILMTLKSYWKQLTDDNKDVVWKYLVLLYKLNDKCIEAWTP